MDYRIPGVPLSAVKRQDTHRKDKLKQLIEKFENHPNKESFLQDFKQTKEINDFSKESQDPIADMNNTEIFEFCEISSKQQCPDCNLFWEAGIVYCSCGRCLRISRNEKEVDKSDNDVVSIPGYVIKKNNKSGATYGASERQRMFHKAKEMIKRNMEDTHPFLRDGSATTSTESRCRTLDGLSRTSCYLTELSWKIIHTSRRELREVDTRNT